MGKKDSEKKKTDQACRNNGKTDSELLRSTANTGVIRTREEGYGGETERKKKEEKATKMKPFLLG
jgi:hypothetical protein